MSQIWRNRIKSIGIFCFQHRRVGVAVLAGLLPLLGCLLTCAGSGHTLQEVYLPTSEWNDELFYYKQVEGIIRHGFPYGYFGFNESHARALSFAAWSPFLVAPWVLMGFLFGWNLLSPVIYNILLLGIAFFTFVLLVKPSGKQLGLLTMLYLLFTPITRYLLSGMPEIICISFLICFYSIGIHYQKTGKRKELIILFFLAVWMTLMRPYFVLFLLLPCFFLSRRYPKKGFILSVGVLMITGVSYALIHYYWSAEYFTPLFYTDWLTAFFTEGFWTGTKLTMSTLWEQGKRFFGLVITGIRTGDATGAYFTSFLTVLFLLLIQTVDERRKGHKAKAAWYGYLTLCFVMMLGAVLLMYHKMQESSKHLLTFVALGIFAVSCMKTKYYKKAALLGGIFLLVFWIQAADPYEYQVPYQTQTVLEEQTYWKDRFKQLEVVTQNIPNYDNSVIWTFNGVTKAGTILFPWQALYQLPQGFGISCCYREYVIEHFGELKSRYLGVVADSELDHMCQEAGYVELGREGNGVVYKLR
jgi:chromate transport protein ChrA